MSADIIVCQPEEGMLPAGILGQRLEDLLRQKQPPQQSHLDHERRDVGD